MPQSRKDKSRKQKLLKYKNSKKMNDNANTAQMNPNFQPVPNWKSTDKFEINGAELEALYGFFNIFSPALTAVQQVFGRGLQQGKIKIEYVYPDGTPVNDEEVKAATERINEHFKNQASKEKDANRDELAPQKPEAGRVLDMHGAEVTTENV